MQTAEEKRMRTANSDSEPAMGGAQGPGEGRGPCTYRGFPLCLRRFFSLTGFLFFLPVRLLRSAWHRFRNPRVVINIASYRPGDAPPPSGIEISGEWFDESPDETVMEWISKCAVNYDSGYIQQFLSPEYPSVDDIRCVVVESDGKESVCEATLRDDLPHGEET